MEQMQGRCSDDEVEALRLQGAFEALTRAPGRPDVQAEALLWLGRTDAGQVRLEGALSEVRGVDPAMAARLTTVLAMAYRLRGSAQTAVDLAERAVQAHPDRTRALTELAWAYLEAGRTAAVGALVDEASEGAQGTARLGLDGLRATLALAGGALHDGRRLASVLLRDAKRAGSKHDVACALTLLARATIDQRDYKAARKLHLTAMPLHRAHGHRGGVAASLGGLGLANLGLQLIAEGTQHLVRAVRLLEEVGHLRAEAAWRIHLDHAAVLLDRPEWRIKELEKFVVVARRLGDHGHEADLMATIGHTWVEIRRPDLAAPWYGRATDACDALGDGPRAASYATHQALSLATAGDPAAQDAIAAAASRPEVPPELLAQARAAL